MNGSDEPPLIAVLDYGIRNLRSAQKGFERAGADVRLTADPALIADAAGVVLPGVGHFGACMRELRAAKLDGLAISAIDSGTPFLGICVGMQMLFEGSEEAPGIEGLGALPGMSRCLPDGLTRPQMQWNQLDIRLPGCPLLHGIEDGAWMYFVHSYAVDTDPDLVVATCEYGIDVTAMVGKGSLWATQFHPEKSGERGRCLAQNFLQQVTSS
ncbi:MAG: imidazole glycerol phosphate synthase subunit HisH [Actinomycetota bacterium]|nr:imidazole glycerol phosphate synthase subunit HisH [Actinomycetota bacterium]